MEHLDPVRASPFPLDGGRVGVGGARAGFAEDGDKGFDGASRAPIADADANTPSQPSPVEGEGFSRFGRTDRVSGKMVRRARALDMEDEILKASAVTHGGAVVHEGVRG